jgi:antilisterial bacteriocin subtilosin biosynthesis protein AlbA
MTAHDTRPCAESYLSVREGVQIHRQPEGGFLLVPVRGPLRHRALPGMERVSHSPYRTEGYLLDYLAGADGTRSRAELDALFVEQYGELFGPLLADRCWAFIEEQAGQLFELCAEPRLTPAPIRVTGSRAAFYPTHATLEIIETCNMTCDHCYYSSSPQLKGRMTLADATRIMDRLAQNGVRVVELTGGECTIHPNFSEILNHACDTFDLVGVLTNGYRLGTNERLRELICSKNNLMVQISLDAVGARHDTFRKHPRAYEAAVNAIRHVVAAGLICRVASSIVEENLDQVGELYEVVRALGVDKHSFAAVAPHGRGCNTTEGVGAAELTRKLNAQLAKYAEDKRLYDTPVTPEHGEGVPAHNCGAGSKTFAVDQKGDVRACNFSRDSKKFGNVVSDDFDVVFGQQASFYFANAPSPGGRDCVGCDYYDHCRGCFVKAFMVSETTFKDCPWRKHWFPEMSLQLDSQAFRESTSRLTASEKLDRLPQRTLRDFPQLCGSHREGADRFHEHPGRDLAGRRGKAVHLKVV